MCIYEPPAYSKLFPLKLTYLLLKKCEKLTKTCYLVPALKIFYYKRNTTAAELGHFINSCNG